MREWGKRSFCLVCMFLVLTGMPVTVQAADYDGGTGSAEKTQETYLKTFLEDLDFAELDTWTKEELFPEQREKFSFSVMVQELLADGIGVTSMEKIGQWLCDALLYEIKTGKTILVEVVLLAAGFSMLKNFSGTFEKNYDVMRDVSKTFNPGTVNEKCALKNLNLTLKQGDFATIVGSNGAGKSTLFNAITGAFFADKGLIMLDGEDITYQKEHVRSKVIGHLFQDPLKGTAPHMTIEENMALAYLRTTTSKNAYFSRIKAADKKKFREQLALLDMGLEDRMKQPVGLLSGGQRQALTLLMATMVTPKILLLDEHTAALDPATAEKVLNLTKKIVSEQNITCLMVTHNMHQALELGNRTLMMDSGNIVLDVSGEEREKMSVDDLLEQFAVRAGKALDNDRILFSKVEA